MSLPLMKCGHTAQGTRQADGAPVCIICLGTTPNAEIIEDTPPDLSNRKMRCSYMRGRNGQPCPGRTQPIPSNVQAAFFSHLPDEEFDSFYDGCWGWD